MRGYTENRLLCYVLEDMRSCCKTHNYAPMAGLIEEVQIMGNKMEAGLDTQHDYWEMVEDCKAIMKQREKLRSKLREESPSG
ncbi:MAG: hypothetical protein GY841_22485 [FCB group bacterium]|nr:hypothetical protein [FCB group bacterium]